MRQRPTPSGIASFSLRERTDPTPYDVGRQRAAKSFTWADALLNYTERKLAARRRTANRIHGHQALANDCTSSFSKNRKYTSGLYPPRGLFYGRGGGFPLIHWDLRYLALNCCFSSVTCHYSQQQTHVVLQIQPINQQLFGRHHVTSTTNTRGSGGS